MRELHERIEKAERQHREGPGEIIEARRVGEGEAEQRRGGQAGNAERPARHGNPVARDQGAEQRKGQCRDDKGVAVGAQDGKADDQRDERRRSARQPECPPQKLPMAIDHAIAAT